MFPLFRLTQMWGDMWCVAMNHMGRAQSDAANQAACCNECSCVCVPCIVVADILSCPCQAAAYCFFNNCENSKNNSGETTKT